MSDANRAEVSTKWLDALKGIAVLWIFLNHSVERALGSPYIANPSADWPPLRERMLQLLPVDYGSTISDGVLNVLRYLGWAGDQGVQLFLIASGFGLTFSMLQRGDRDGWAGFYRRRLGRIYPLWWGAHIAFLIPSFFVGRGLQLFDPRFFLSFLGFRATPGLIYYFSPAWWYVGLIIQLYLVYPFLAELLRRMGAARFLAITLGASSLVRLAGLYAFEGYLDAWSRGGILITRLPEFAFGMALAWWWQSDPNGTDRRLRKPATLLLAALAYVGATALSLTLWGMTVAPFLQGVAALVWIYAALRVISGRTRPLIAALVWVGAHSYSLYLVHHPVILYLMDHSGHPTVLQIAFALPVLTIALGAALALEWMVDRVWRRIRDAFRHVGVITTAARVAALAIALTALMISVESMVRKLDPQEVYGWGERPSLQPDEKLGWRLIPDHSTRLRWESYDYLVQANELGFPGPLYPQARSPGTFRIMTLGDAFTSAEGVDTDQAWPRLLEGMLETRLETRGVEVLNFAITGYGPNQFVAVLKEYGPQYRPDLILVGFFVNEYFDVLVSDDEVRRSIGFQSTAQESLRGYLEAIHLRKWLTLRVGQPVRELLSRSPRSHGYFLGNFASLETGSGGITETGRELVELRLAETARLAQQIDAKLLLLLIPAPVQICGPDSLRYFPRVVNISDGSRFDMNRPQKITEQIAGELGLVTYDFRGPLRALDTCPYQPRNMHWLAAGHEAVAEYMCQMLIRDGHVTSLPVTQGD